MKSRSRRTGPAHAGAVLGRVLLALTLALLLAPARARAQCDAGTGPDGGISPDQYGILRDTFPADNDVGVPTDGLVRIRYLGRAPTSAAMSVAELSTGIMVPGSAAVLGDQVVWQSASPLQPQVAYTARFSDASGGLNRITFTTGSGATSGPAVFGGINGATSQRITDQTCDPNGVNVTVKFDRVADTFDGSSWPAGDIEYVVFETRGPHITGPRERDRVRLLSSGSPLDLSGSDTFYLAGVDATEPVCFNIQAVDPAGRADGNRAETCVNPNVGNYFAGCSVRRPFGSGRSDGGGGAGGTVLVAAVLTALGRVVRTRRGASGRPSRGLRGLRERGRCPR